MAIRGIRDAQETPTLGMPTNIQRPVRVSTCRKPAPSSAYYNYFQSLLSIKNENTSRNVRFHLRYKRLYTVSACTFASR